MVVTEGDDVGLYFFYDHVGIAQVAQDCFVNDFALLDGFQSQQLASFGKGAFYIINGNVPRNNGSQMIAQRFCLLKKIYVAGVKAIKGAEHQNLFHFKY